MPCPQCKAVYANDETCYERFNTSQLTELEHPDYYTVHHLSVFCYMLQNHAYSAKGWLAGRDLLRRFIAEKITPQEARRSQTATNSRRRSWSYTRGPKLSEVDNVAWSMTIADIRLDTADHYCADIRAWAECILKDSERISSEVPAA